MDTTSCTPSALRRTHDVPSNSPIPRLAATLLCATLVACGGSGGDGSTGNTDPVATSSSGGSSGSSSGTGSSSGSTSSSGGSSSGSSSGSTSSSSGGSSSGSSSGTETPEIGAYVAEFLAVFDENMNTTPMESWSFNLHNLQMTQVASPGDGVLRYRWSGTASVQYSYLPMGCNNIAAQVPGNLILDVFVSGSYAGHYWWNWETTSSASVHTTCSGVPMDLVVQPPNLSSSCQSPTPGATHTYSNRRAIAGTTTCPVGNSGTTFGHEANVSFTAQ